MAHITRDGKNKNLLARIKRIRGQINGVAKAVEEERDCGDVLLTLAACRGAINSLMAEIMEGHVRFHMMRHDTKPDRQAAHAAEELIEVIRRYLK